MSGIRAVLWDVGGVLLTNSWDHLQRDAVVPRFGLDRAVFEHRHAEVADAWERDEITVDEYLVHTVFFEPRNFTQADFLSAMRAQSTVLPDSALGILQQLAASDKYALAMVNNESRAMNDYRLETFGLREHFRAFFGSCYVGLRKPNPKIYRLALDVLQCDAEEAVFVDDRAENAAAAAALGIRAIRYEGSRALAARLSELGVRVSS